MRWAIVVLIILGILAAFSASLLVKALRSENEMGGKGETNAVIAAKSLPAMSQITSQNITIKKVPRKGLFDNYFSEPVQVVGKVLAVPVIEGQVISKSFLIGEGTGAQLAAVLQPGMRAVSVPVSANSVMGGLLYPGCLVDVIATFKLRYQDERGQAISTTLLHGVQVLAIQDESIVSKIDLSSRSASRGSEGQVTVTLMVDTRQAEALQLAMDSGKISLSMRNPLDQKTVDTEGMVLSQGRLASVTDPDAKSAERLGGGRGMTVIRGREVKEEAIGLPVTDVVP
jgi:pilus assembly protein CpaB